MQRAVERVLNTVVAMATTVDFAVERPAVLLFGDSITQEGSTTVGGWGQLLSGYYSRRADVINRGLSGYNTRWALDALDGSRPPHSETLLATIWFGANDAADEKYNPRQHVDLSEYKENLKNLVAKMRKVTKNIIVLSPPPIQQAMYKRVFVVPKAGPDAPEDRSWELAKTYAAAAREVSNDEGVAFIDVFEKMMDAAGNPDEESLGPYFYDGLHLSEKGNRFIFDQVVATVETAYPDLAVTRCPYTFKVDNSSSQCSAIKVHMPWHDWINLENQGSVFDTEAMRAKQFPA